MISAYRSHPQETILHKNLSLDLSLPMPINLHPTTFKGTSLDHPVPNMEEVIMAHNRTITEGLLPRQIHGTTTVEDLTLETIDRGITDHESLLILKEDGRIDPRWIDPRWIDPRWIDPCWIDPR
jgi:hypothetical protein